MLLGCKEEFEDGIWSGIVDKFDPRKKENRERSEDKTEELLKDMYNQAQDNEYRIKKSRLKLKKTIVTIIQIVASIIVLGLFLAMGLILSYLCINTDAVRGLIKEHNISDILIDVLIAVVLIAVSAAVFGLRLLIDWMSERMARLGTSIAYYNKKDRSGNLVRNGNFNSFRYGWRKTTTFQDKSELNRKRQHLRWVLWACLFLTIVSGLVISIVFNAFPLFFSIGCPAIIVFMYVDYLPSAKHFFYSCHYPNAKKKYPSTRLQEAYYFKQEYKDSQVNGKYKPFDLNSKYYEQNCRNLLKIIQPIHQLIK